MNQTVLFIAYVWPELKSTAASQNIITYARLFQELNYSVCFASAAQITEQSLDFEAQNIEPINIALNCDSFDDMLRRVQPDVVVFDRFLTEEQYAWRVTKTLPGCVRILDCEDLHCLREARRLEYKQLIKESRYHQFPRSNIPDCLFGLDITKREIAAIFRSDLSIVLSSFEENLLHLYFNIPTSSLVHVSFLGRNTVADTPNFADRKNFASIGSFKHEPNWDAVLTLKNHIWPLIRSQLKTSECFVYGSYLPPKAKALENKAQGFWVQGFTPDAHQTLSEHRVLLAPINFGAGIKGKLIDAMQVATPSVTTEIGAEGITTCNQSWPGMIEQEFEQFANSAITLHESEAAWQSASNLSSACLDAGFNHEEQSQILVNKIEDIQDNLNEHRNNNFIGSMLLHHSMASTQYMGQWISAKSKLKQGL
jgi:hypothetical protein